MSHLVDAHEHAYWELGKGPVDRALGEFEYSGTVSSGAHAMATARRQPGIMPDNRAAGSGRSRPLRVIVLPGALGKTS